MKMKPVKIYARLWTTTVIKNQEDELLKSLVESIGPKNWKIVSDEFNKKSGIRRSPKQCRDRWASIPKTGRKMKFNKKQILNIFEMFEVYGSRWSVFAKHFPNFSENDIKNFLNSTVRRNIRRFNKNRKQEEKIITNSLQLLNIDELKPLLMSEKSQKQIWYDSLVLSKEASLMIRSLEISSNNYNEMLLSPILDIISSESTIFYDLDKTDLPCEDLFS